MARIIDHPLGSIYSHMKQRCFNPKATKYERYGGRGITICQRWLDSFEAFVLDMGPRPPGYQIDRIDNDGPYSPENCRWVSAVENNNNRSDNITVLIDGIRRPLAMVIVERSLPKNRIYGRLKRGWTPEQAIDESRHSSGRYNSTVLPRK